MRIKRLIGGELMANDIAGLTQNWVLSDME